MLRDGSFVVETPKCLKLFTVGLIFHDFWLLKGNSKMASNAIHTVLIDFLRKEEVFTLIFWFLLEKIWDPKGCHLHFALIESSMFSEIVLEIDISLFGFLFFLNSLHSALFTLRSIEQSEGFHLCFISDNLSRIALGILAIPVCSLNMYAELGLLDFACLSVW